MKRIILTESQYKRLVNKKLNEEITPIGEKVNSFDIELEGEIVRRWDNNNPEHVERIQRMLKSLDYELGPYGPNKDGVDGKYGPYTEDAVREFQEDEMPDQPDQHDGEVGPITYQLLKDKVDDKADDDDVDVDDMLYSVSGDEEMVDYEDEDEDISDLVVRGDNGNIPESELTFIGTDVEGNDEYLDKNAGIMFNKMKSDASKKGVNIKLSDAYRPCGHPGDYEKYKKGEIRFSQWAAWEKYKYNGKKAARPKPDTPEKWIEKGGGKCKSNHGLGKAIDVSGSTAKKWVRDNGSKYGFMPYSEEDWHFDFKQHKVKKEFKHLIK